MAQSRPQDQAELLAELHGALHACRKCLTVDIALRGLYYGTVATGRERKPRVYVKWADHEETLSYPSR